MTYDDERLSARWKERRARFLGCIENTKLIAERTKQRQESARQERLKKERAEMEKYRRRFFENAMKQHMEQQAKTREAVTSMAHATGPHHRPHAQPLPRTQGYLPGCMQAATRATAPPFVPNHQSMPACRPNSRKRPFENGGGWTQYAHMAIACDPRNNVYSGREPQMYQNGFQPVLGSNSMNYPNMMPRQQQMPHCPPARSNGEMDVLQPEAPEQIERANGVIQELQRAEQYDQARLGNSMVPTTSHAQPQVAPPVAACPAIPEEMNSLPGMQELAESHMKDLMDQFGTGNLLDDLGGNCLDGVLVNRCEEQQYSTATAEADGRNVQSVTNSVVSPMTAACDTPNSAISPAQLPASTGCSTNSLFDSRSAVVTPQQSALTPCDQQQQQQRIPIDSTAAVSVAPGAAAVAVAAVRIMAPENPLHCTTANTVRSTSSGSSVGSINAAALPGNMVAGNGDGSCSTTSSSSVMYSNAATAAAPSTPFPHQMQLQQQQYPFYLQQQYSYPGQQQQEQQEQQQQQFNLFNNGGCYQMSVNNAHFAHLDNRRLYNGAEYARFGQYNGMYNNCASTTSSSIFPKFTPQALMRYPMPQQYGGAYPMQFANNAMPYYAQQQQQQQQQQPAMGMQQQAYPLPSFESAHQRQHFGNDPAVVARNQAYQLNHF